MIEKIHHPLPNKYGMKMREITKTIGTVILFTHVKAVHKVGTMEGALCILNNTEIPFDVIINGTDNSPSGLSAMEARQHSVNQILHESPSPR